MPNLGELTRLYQAALEEQRICRDRSPDDPEGFPGYQHIVTEVARTRADMETAWLERCCA